MNLSSRSCFFMATCLVLVLGLALPAAQGSSGEVLSKGQLVYVPVYSHVYHGDSAKKMLLTGILSIRNTDPAHSITITKADYYDSDGNLLKSYLSQSITLKPMASTRFIVKESDACGGSGANFLVKWQAETEVNEPLIEGVMIGTAGQQGISFTSRGKPIKEK